LIYVTNHVTEPSLQVPSFTFIVTIGTFHPGVFPVALLLSLGNWGDFRCGHGDFGEIGKSYNSGRIGNIDRRIKAKLPPAKAMPTLIVHPILADRSTNYKTHNKIR
jgi:hypothetical protein